jgi:hypothetical protein
MSDSHDPNDSYRHRNLMRISQVLHLPMRADAERQTRWQQATLPSPAAGPGKAISVMKRYGRFAVATSGLAAAIVLAVWLSLGQTSAVSAATIFDTFKTALAQSLSIHVAGIDFDNARVNGDIVLDRPGPGVENDTQYAEVHVLLRADNPEWNDIDAVLAICQTATDAWQYCRGNGGSATARGHATPTEYLVQGIGWRDFARQPLDHFGGMPLELDFERYGSKVAYLFTREQRIVVEQLLRFLLELSNAETTDEVIAGLKAAAGDVRVERRDPSTYVLRATRFARLGELELVEPVAPDVSDLLKQVVFTFHYDLASQRITSTRTQPPRGLYETGVAIRHDTSAFPLAAPDELVTFLQQRAVDVQVDKSGAGEWVFRVTGFPFPTDTSGLKWLGQYLRALRDSLNLSIYYNADSRAVQRAEFEGIGPSGRIALNIGQVELDPARLKREYWITPETMIWKR